MTQKKKPNNKIVKEVNNDEKLWEFHCFSGLLKKMIEKIKPIEKEFPMDITKEGIHVRVVDPSHVCMLDLDIPKKDFYTGHDAVNKNVEFKIKQDMRVGLPIERIENKFLKLINQYDYVTGYIQNNCLYLNTDTVHTKISLIDPCGLAEPKLPTFNLSISGKVSSDRVSILQKAKDGSDHITFIADKTGLYGIIEDDEDDIRLDLNTHVKGEGRAVYSTDYLGNILNASSSIELNFDTDHPVKITGVVGDNGKYLYLLAPRIESE